MHYTDEQILAWLAGELDDKLSGAVAGWVESSTEAQQRVAELRSLDQLFTGSLEYEPPAEMLYAFREKIAEERERGTSRFRWYRVAAAIVLLFGGFAIGQLSPVRDHNTAELADLKNKVQVLQQAAMLTTLHNYTASERLKAINTIDTASASAGTNIIGALVYAMNYDRSPNVRTAAVEALGRYIGRDTVRAEIVHSLGEQDNPLVQITMINVLTKAREKSAIGPIMKIADNENSLPEVRQTAEIALNVLI